jgi:hypothetical protein
MDEPITKHDAERGDGYTVRFTRDTQYGYEGQVKKLSASTARTLVERGDATYNY